MACEFYGDVDPREYDNIVVTDIFIRVESPAENPACPENPLDEPLGTYCLTPLDPISCTQDSDCEDIGMEIAMDYENQLGEKWDPLIEDYLCRPAVRRTVSPQTLPSPKRASVRSSRRKR